MARKRGPGEGSIYQREDGRWTAQTPPDPQTGKRKYIYGKTHGDVQRKLTIAKRALDQGLPLTNDRQTVQQFLTRWLEDVVRPNKRASTYRGYELNVRRYLIPALGRHKLTTLSPQHVQVFLNAQHQEGLSGNTVKQMRDVLRAALNQAVKWGDVTRNVAPLANLPRVKHQKRGALDQAQAAQLFAAIRGERLEVLYSVAVSLGMRLGEILGLRWQDVDLERRRLRVTGAMQRVGRVGEGGGLRRVEPKSDTSRRAIDLPDGMVRALREHKLRQEEDRLQTALPWPDNDLIFRTKPGAPLDGPNVNRYLQRHLASAGLPKLTFHSLRHSCASLLAAQGYSAFEVSRLLGHSDVRLTINTYTHEFDRGRRQLADAMGWVFDEADDAESDTAN